MITRSIAGFLLLVAALQANAQNDTSQPRKNVMAASVNYQSRLHFFGRTDNLRSAGLFSTIRLESKTGLYATGSAIMLQNQQMPLSYTGSIVEAGYAFPASRNFSGNLFFSRFLYNDDSQLVQSALKSQAGINLAYNNKIVNVNGGVDARFSNRTDIGLTAGLDHLFIYVIPNTKNAIAVNPSVNAYAGTQNFSKTYIQKREVLGIPTGQQQTVNEQVNKLNILAYEVSVPVVLVAGKFNTSITSSYIMPQNLITVADQPQLNEQGKNMFYITASIGVRL